MAEQSDTRYGLIYRHHPIKYLKLLVGVALLIVLGAVGLWLWLPLGIGLGIVAAVLSVGVYLEWRQTMFWFTVDHRLVYRRGFRGNEQDTISLFGKLSYKQIPLVGQWLDVGTINMLVPGATVQLKHIGNFASFYDQLVTGPTPVKEAEPQYVPVLFVPVVGHSASAQSRPALYTSGHRAWQHSPDDDRPYGYGP